MFNFRVLSFSVVYNLNAVFVPLYKFFLGFDLVFKGFDVVVLTLNELGILIVELFEHEKFFLDLGKVSCHLRANMQLHFLQLEGYCPISLAT